MTTIFTYNIDWATSNAKERLSIKSILTKAAVVCWQEAKHIQINNVTDDTWSTHQNVQDHAKQGVAVSWKHKEATRYMGESKNSRTGYVLGSGPRGLRILPRYFNYRDLQLADGRVIRFVSTHRPPQRFKMLWRLFDHSLASFIRRSPHPVIVGMDSNANRHTGLSRVTKLQWHGIGIDGFLVDKSIKVTNLTRHPKVKSDHHPVSIDI